MRFLVVSSDESLLSTQALLLTSAGFEAFTALDLPSALRAANYYTPHVVVLSHTLSEGTQYSYFEQLEQSVPGMQYLCLTTGVTPEMFLQACHRAVSSPSPLNRLNIMKPSVALVGSVA